jgi:hypothetical protein
MRFKDRSKLDSLSYLLQDYHRAQESVGNCQKNADFLWEIFTDTLEDFLSTILEREPTAEDYEQLDIEQGVT